MLKSNLLLSTAIALVLAVQPMKAAAALSSDAIVADLQAQGFSYIEITHGLTQSKIEATKGTTTVETIIDNETGEVLKTETEAADPEDVGRTGVKTRTRDRDFVDVNDEDDDEDGDDDDSDDDGDDDRDDDGDDDRDDDRDDGDDGDNDSDGDDHGGDDHGGDDHGGDDHGGDDHGGDDRGGDDRGGDD